MSQPSTRLSRRHLLALGTFLVPLTVLAVLGWNGLRRRGAMTEASLEREARRFLASDRQAIEQRIQALTESADRDGIARVTRQLDQLHEDLEDLREATERAGEAQVTMPAAPSALPGSAR